MTHAGAHRAFAHGTQHQWSLCQAVGYSPRQGQVILRGMLHFEDFWCPPPSTFRRVDAACADFAKLRRQEALA